VKHSVLTSIGHNFADSLASGIGLMIGVYAMDVFGEAACSPEGFIEVDFLTGCDVGSAALALACSRDPPLCRSLAGTLLAAGSGRVRL